MDIVHLIDQLEEIAQSARKLPVGGGSVVSRQRLLDLVDRMRVAVPKEVYEAREVLERKGEVLAEGEREAAELLEQARAEMEKRLNETEVVKAAHDRARELIKHAEERAGDLLRDAEEQARARLDEAQAASREEMREADVYALQTLRRLEEQLDGFMMTVRNGIDALEQRAAERPGG
jgi:vacuolar-type H+-ATPase subunit H